MDEDLKQLLIEVEKDLLRAMDGKVAQEVKQVYREEVEYMYTEFEPEVYQRRYEKNGFLDESNWDTNVDLINDGVSLILTNETMANGDDQGYRLDTFIEEGIYEWSRRPPARPVYERTQERLDTEQVVENTLELELKKRGWDLK